MNVDARAIPPREVGLLAVISWGVAMLMHLPLLPRLGSSIPYELRDPLLQAWQVAWGGYALTHRPLSFFDSNTFWPLDNTLAFSDALIGYAPFGIIGSGPEAALIRYNLLFLFCYALAFFGAALLARELGVERLASLVAGAAYAYAPWRLAQNHHMHVIASGGIPLALFLLYRGYRRSQPRMIVAGWLVAAWQVSIGFTLGIHLFYLLVILATGAIVICWRADRPRLDRRVWRATLTGGAAFLLWCGVQAKPLLDVQDRFPESIRTPAVAAFFSPPPRGLLAAPESSLLWGDATKPVRDSLPWWTEQALFPGIVIALLALVGIFASPLSRRLRIGLVVGAAVTLLLSFGYAFLEGRWTYRFLFDYVPGFSGSRTPGRLYTLTSLALALLAAGATHWVADKVFSEGDRRKRAAVLIVPILVAGAVLLEGYGRLDLPEVPFAPEGLREVTAPALHLPSDDFNDAMYMFWSTDGFPPIANGVSGFLPALLDRMRAATVGFPDADSVALLKDVGIEVVVFHPGFAVGTPYEGVGTRPIEGLGIEREIGEGFVVYRLSP